MPYRNDESTKQLFKAIDDENLEAFKQALAEGADVNAFDEGYTPLMAIIMNGDDSPICLKMMMLLLQHQSLNINAQETKEHNTALHLAFRMENRNFIRMLLRHPNLDIYVKNSYLLIKPEYQQLSEEYLRDFHKERFFHTPKEYIEKVGRIQKRNFSHLTMEIMEAQKGKKLLDALSKEDVNQAKTLLDQKLNPNCWRKIRDGRIKTPLSLIIRSCLRTITEDKKEVLTKLLKHKDLGSVDKILEKPYKSSNKIEKTHKNLSSFIKSGKNAPKIFNFTKKTLNQMTFFVDMLIVIPLHFSIPFWRNNYCTSLVFKTCNKGIAIVALVSYYSRVIDTFGQHLCLRNFISLTRSQSKFKWISKCIDKRMYFSCKATFAPP